MLLFFSLWLELPLLLCRWSGSFSALFWPFWEWTEMFVSKEGSNCIVFISRAAFQGLNPNSDRLTLKIVKRELTRVEGIPGYFYYPGTGIPGYFRKNTRVYPGIQNPLHKKQKSSLMSWKMHWFDVFWPYFILLWTYSSKNIDKNFTKKFWKKFLIL